MKTLRFEVTLTLADGSTLPDDDVAALVSDGIGYIFDDSPWVEDFVIIQIVEDLPVNKLVS